MDVIEPSRFGDALKRYRVAAGLSQQELAERAHMTAQGISALERGVRRTPYRETVRLLAEALRLGTEDRAALQDAARPRLAATHDAPRALPVQPTSLIGRDRDVAALLRQLQDADTRLLTLTGPGGVGKTRVAAHVASQCGGAFPDGVLFVALAAVRDPDLVSSAIAEALGMMEAGRRPVAAAIVGGLRDRRVLLVLDNFEHLMPAAPHAAELLAGCPHLKIMVTSRAHLHLRGEHEWPVSPLDLPDLSGSPDSADLARCGAVALFVERARAVKPDFRLDETTAHPVAAICARLDGLPLAIELAAARIKHLPPRALLARLDHRFQVLTGGARDLPARQQTMRDTIGWSYDLLHPDEQALFRQIAVFAGGCTLDTAEAVCDLSGDPDEGASARPGTDMLAGLSTLVDNSLMQQRESGGDARFTMLDTVREYALDRLASAGESAATQRRLADCMLSLAEVAEPELTREHQEAWLARLEQEHDNIRAALHWAGEGARHGDEQALDVGIRLAAATWHLWWSHGHFSEGRGWLEQLLALDECSPCARPATASTEWGEGHSRDAMGERVALRAKLLTGGGILAAEQADYTRATALFEEAHSLLGWLGDAAGAADALNNLGMVARDQGNYAHASRLFARSLPILRERGDQSRIASALSNLGEVARYQGKLARAATLHEQSLAMRRDVGDKGSIAVSLYNLGLVACDQGDRRRAAQRYVESLTLFDSIGDRVGMAWILEGLAAVAHAEGQRERAVYLYAAAAALRDAVGAPLPPAARSAYDRGVALLRAVCEDSAAACGADFETLWERGQALPLIEVIDDAMSMAPGVALPSVRIGASSPRARSAGARRGPRRRCTSPPAGC